MATIATLAINLIAQTNRFTRPLASSTRHVETFTKKSEDGLKRVEQMSKRAAVSLTALKGSVIIAAKLASDYASNVSDVADQTGLMVESVQQLSYAVSQSGGDFGLLQTGLRAFVRRAAEAAEGNASFLKGFERLGLSQQEVRSGLNDIEGLMMRVADSAANMGTEAEASAALMAVFGEAGRKLVPFMRQGSSGIRGLMDEAVRLGLVLDQKSVRQLAAFGDSAQRTQNRVGALSREMAVQFLPVLNTVNDWINRGIDLLMGLDDQTKRNAAMLATITAAVLGFVVGLGMLAAGASLAVKALGVIGAIFGFLTSPVVLAIAGIVLFAKAWKENWLGIRDVTETVWGAIGSVWDVISKPLSVVWQWTARQVGNAWRWLSGPAWDWVKDTAWPAVTSALSTAWAWTATQLGRAWDWLSGPAWEWVRDTAWPTLTSALSTAWRWTATQAGAAWDWLSGPAWNWIKDTGWPTLVGALSVAWTWTANQAGVAWRWLSGPAWEWIRNTAWPALTNALSVAWEWTANQLGAAWDWLSGPAWEWLRDTAWPTLTENLGVAWEWAATRAGDAWSWLTGTAWDWVKDTAWPAVTGALSVAWTWTAKQAGQAWRWLSGPVWDWVTDTAWPALTNALSVTWAWTATQLGKAWDWLSGPAWTWIKDTAWPNLTSALSAAWIWTANQAGAAWDWLSGPAWDWVKDTGWPALTSALSTAWTWTATQVGHGWRWLSGPAWTWLKDTAWPTLTGALSVAWEWTANQLGAAWDWLSGPAWEWVRDTAWPKVSGALSVAWKWTATQSGQAWRWLSGPAWEWIKDTAWPRMTQSVSVGWNWAATQAGKAWEWLSGPAWDWVKDTAWPSLKAGFSVVWRWTAEKAGTAWEWVTETLIPWVTGPAWEVLSKGAETTWSWIVDTSDSVLAWLKDTAWPYIDSVARTSWEWTVSFAGEMYDAIKEGFETGDWSRAIGIGAETWRSGIKLAVGLALAAGTTAQLLTLIRTGMGLSVAAVTSLGMPGVIGVLSIAVALLEAWSTGDFKKFGADLIAALAVGIGIGVFTGSPWAGALAFTIVLNFEIGTWVGDRIEALMESETMKSIRRFVGTEATQEALDHIEFWSLADEDRKSRVAQLANDLSDGQFVITAPPTLWDRIKGFFGGIWKQDQAPTLNQFQSGGYTGNAPVNRIVGVVHGQEIVVPAPAVRRGLPGILEWLGVPGFQSGLMQPIPGLSSQTQAGLAGAQSFLNSMASQIGGIVDMMDSGIESLLNMLEVTLLNSARDLLPEETYAALEERTLSLTRTVRQGWESFKGLFQASEDAADAASNAAAALDDLEAVAARQAALNTFVNTLLQRMPLIMTMMRGAEMGAALGRIGVVVGALTAVALESETVAAGFGMLNNILIAGANALGMLIRPILPLVYVLQSVLVPIFTVLGQVLEMVLLPIMPTVFEGLRWLGVGALFVAEVFQTVRGFILNAVGALVEGLGRLIDALPLVSAKNIIQAGVSMRKSAEAAYESIRELGDARRDLIDLTYEEALARAKSTDALERATGALRNVPSGFRYALAQFDASTPKPMTAAEVYRTVRAPNISGNASGSPSTVEHHTHFHINGDVYGWDDFKKQVKKADAENKRTGSLAAFGLT